MRKSILTLFRFFSPATVYELHNKHIDGHGCLGIDSCRGIVANKVLLYSSSRSAFLYGPKGILPFD